MCPHCGTVVDVDVGQVLVDCPKCQRQSSLDSCRQMLSMWWLKDLKRRPGKRNDTDYESIEQKEKENKQW